MYIMYVFLLNVFVYVIFKEFSLPFHLPNIQIFVYSVFIQGFVYLWLRKELTVLYCVVLRVLLYVEGYFMTISSSFFVCLSTFLGNANSWMWCQKGRRLIDGFVGK